MKIRPEMMDPELRFIGRIIRAIPPFSTLNALRRMDRLNRFLFQGKKPKDLQAQEVLIPRRDGGKLRLMVYKPMHAAGKLPGVLWIHGGGYQLGVPENDGAVYRRLIGAAPCIIVSPDYRLSIEQPYPAALDDCYDALLWLKRQADELGVRDDQLAVAGGSAGGGLTAAVTLFARDQGEVNIAFQMPLYPMMDDRRSMVEDPDENDAPGWSAASNRNAWRQYLGPLYGKAVPPYAAPSRAVDYRGLPPTCTLVGDLDPFHDEIQQYVQDLKTAGVPVAFQVFQGAYHAFEGVCPNSTIAKRAIAFYVDWFVHAVRSYFAQQGRPTPGAK